MPSARALRVIWRANSSSEPARFSATTTAASLADRVTMPLIASSTVMVPPSRSPSLVGDWPAACSETLQLAVERELAGFQPLEQHVERHDLGERCRMADRVGVGRMQDRAGVGIDHDRGVARAVGARRRGGALAAAVAASAGSLATAVRAIAVARLNNPQRSPCRASIRIRNILLPRPVLRVTPPAWRLEPLLVLCAVAEPRERAKSGRFQEVLGPYLGSDADPSVTPGATVTATAQSTR